VLESGIQGEGVQVFQLQERKKEHKVQQPTILLAILSKMAQKPEVQFDKLYPKLYNVKLWLLAYQHIAPKPGNMTAGTDGETIDKAGLKLITEMIADLKASRYTPRPARRVYIPKANGRLRPLGIPTEQHTNAWKSKSREKGRSRSSLDLGAYRSNENQWQHFSINAPLLLDQNAMN
jgi:hypothetical protein